MFPSLDSPLSLPLSLRAIKRERKKKRGHAELIILKNVLFTIRNLQPIHSGVIFIVVIVRTLNFFFLFLDHFWIFV